MLSPTRTSFAISSPPLPNSIGSLRLTITSFTSTLLLPYLQLSTMLRSMVAHEKIVHVEIPTLHLHIWDIGMISLDVQSMSNLNVKWTKLNVPCGCHGLSNIHEVDFYQHHLFSFPRNIYKQSSLHSSKPHVALQPPFSSTSLHLLHIAICKIWLDLFLPKFLLQQSFSTINLSFAMLGGEVIPDYLTSKR